MKNIVLIFVFSGLFFFTACKKSSHRISGEIFIVTTDQKNTRLAAVPVKIVKTEKVNKLNDKEAEFVRADYLTVSDSSGKFSTVLPGGKYTLFAKTKRETFTAKEHYYWRINFVVDSEMSNIILTGNNITDLRIEKNEKLKQSPERKLGENIKTLKKSRDNLDVLKKFRESLRK